MVYTYTFLSLIQLRETILADFYQKFGELYPGFADFWYGLSAEETHHADIVGKLSQKISNGEIKCTVDMEKLADLYSFVNDLKQLFNLTKSNSHVFTFQEAVRITAYLEQATMEQTREDFYDINQKEVRQVLEVLRVETAGHYIGIREFAAEYDVNLDAEKLTIASILKTAYDNMKTYRDKKENKGNSAELSKENGELTGMGTNQPDNPFLKAGDTNEYESSNLPLENTSELLGADTVDEISEQPQKTFLNKLGDILNTPIQDFGKKDNETVTMEYLQEENSRLRQELDILKKTVAILSGNIM